MNLLILAAAALSSVMSGETTWGGRDRHPATVNAVCAEPSGDVISLRGKGKGSITALGGVSRKDRLFVSAELLL